MSVLSPLSSSLIPKKLRATPWVPQCRTTDPVLEGGSLRAFGSAGSDGGGDSTAGRRARAAGEGISIT